MTKTERLARAAAREKADIAVRKQRLATIEAQQRAQDTQALRTRRAWVGKAVQEAGLFGLDDRTLAALFRQLTPLAQLPDPVAVLEGLLMDLEVRT